MRWAGRVVRVGKKLMHTQRVMVREAKEKGLRVSRMLRLDRGIKLAMNLGVLGEFIE
jgi:hypothetical protein